MERYRLIGANGSPYSMKLRAILRYRGIPHDWLLRNVDIAQEIAHIQPALIPILQYPDDGSYHIDSTPLAYALEERHPRQKSIIPPEPGHAFLCALIEDMADEWFTKMMFHYRWYYPASIEYSSHWIADESNPGLRGETFREFSKSFRDRQIGRMALVGCTEQNKPIIEAAFHELLALLNPHVHWKNYLFGSRPSLADFAIFGQLKTLSQDPDSQAIMRKEAQHVESWVRVLDDASGVVGEWVSAEEPLPEMVVLLLKMVGLDYLPFLQANTAAAKAGDATFTVRLRGADYSQGTFKYQVKCLQALKNQLASLPGEALHRIKQVLEETHCWDALHS